MQVWGTPHQREQVRTQVRRIVDLEQESDRLKRNAVALLVPGVVLFLGALSGVVAYPLVLVLCLPSLFLLLFAMCISYRAVWLDYKAIGLYQHLERNPPPDAADLA